MSLPRRSTWFKTNFETCSESTKEYVRMQCNHAISNSLHVNETTGSSQLLCTGRAHGVRSTCALLAGRPPLTRLLASEGSLAPGRSAVSLSATLYIMLASNSASHHSASRPTWPHWGTLPVGEEPGGAELVGLEPGGVLLVLVGGGGPEEPQGPPLTRMCLAS